MTDTDRQEIAGYVDLDPRAEVRLDVDRRAGEMTLTLSDGNIEVYMDLPDSPDAWLLLQSLARRIEAKIPEVRLRTVGYQAEHGPHTGPGAFRPVPRPILPATVEQDPFG